MSKTTVFLRVWGNVPIPPAENVQNQRVFKGLWGLCLTCLIYLCLFSMLGRGKIFMGLTLLFISGIAF